MHIGLVTATYSPVINGVTRMVSLYKKHLEAAGHRTTVFTLGKPEVGGPDREIIHSPGLKLAKSGYFFSHQYSTIAQEQLAKVDIIHCHHLVMALEFAKKYGRSPIVYTNHTRYDLYASSYLRLPASFSRILFRFLWPRMTNYSDVVVAPSASAKRLLLSYGIKRPIEVIENGIEVEQFRDPVSPLTKRQLGLAQAGIVAIYVGRLAKEKNLEKLLYEFSVAVRRLPSLYLLLVGSGPARQQLMRLVTQLGIANHVIFRGAIPHEEIANFLGAADFFVTASESEVLPLTIIEAMAAGLPIVALNAPGIADLINIGKTGLLASDLNGDLAHKMLELCSSPAERVRLGQNGYQTSLGYHISRTIEHTIWLYERLLAGQYPNHDGEYQKSVKNLGKGADSTDGQGRAYEVRR